jgi:hypothetical protein
MGIDTRNEAENHGEKCAFIGEFEGFGRAGTQRAGALD